MCDFEETILAAMFFPYGDRGILHKQLIRRKDKELWKGWHPSTSLFTYAARRECLPDVFA